MRSRQREGGKRDGDVAEEHLEVAGVGGDDEHEQRGGGKRRIEDTPAREDPEADNDLDHAEGVQDDKLVADIAQKRREVSHPRIRVAPGVYGRIEEGERNGDAEEDVCGAHRCRLQCTLLDDDHALILRGDMIVVAPGTFFGEGERVGLACAALVEGGCAGLAACTMLAAAGARVLRMARVFVGGDPHATAALVDERDCRTDRYGDTRWREPIGTVADSVGGNGSAIPGRSSRIRH